MTDHGCTSEEFWDWMDSCPATYEIMGTEPGDAVVAFSFQDEDEEDDEEE